MNPLEMNQPAQLRMISALRAQVALWRQAGETIALVPTMGALHEGHIALVKLAQSHARRVLVSIFVNPMQFAPTEDLSKYPRPFEADVARLADVSADGIFCPDMSEMYNTGFCTTISLAGPALVGLEDKFRPTHFAGVATVVAKLLQQCSPDFALFGEKDFQQLAVVRQMVLDLNIPVEIIGGATLREQDGLALSSRNIYLSPQERATAPEIHKTLTRCAAEARLRPIEAVLAEGRAHLEACGFVPDYLELRNAATLAPVTAVEGPCRMLFAGRLGTTRLIDNIAVEQVP